MTADEIANAIRNMNTLAIWYDPGERLIEPHTLGWSAKGDLLLRAFQVSGASKTEEHHDWKLLRVDRMSTCNTDGGSFNGARLGYRRGDKAMKGGIIAEL